MTRPGPAYGTTVALAVTLAVAVFLVLMPAIGLAVPGTDLPAPFPDQHQDAETLSFLTAFLIALPLGLLLAPRLAVRLGDGGAAALAALLAAAMPAVRAGGWIGPGDGVKAVLAAGAVWWACAALLIWRAPALPARPAWAVAAVLWLGALLCFADLTSVSPLGVLAGALLAGGLLAARHARPAGRRLGVTLDAAAVVLVLTAVPDLRIFRPENAPGNLAAALETGIIAFHHDFLLGPANEILHGRPMLVGTASQYGVTSIYLLAGWFQVAPIGYGTLGLLTGALTALWFAAGYAVLRLAGVGRALAAAALAVAVVTLAYNLEYPVGALPQSGPLRFGLPMAAVLAAVASERLGGRAARTAELGALALAAVWSLESFAFTLVAMAGVAAARAALGVPGRRLRALARDTGLALAAIVAGHVAFAAATLAATGELPDWGEYLAYLAEFLTGHLGDLTYDVPRWTPGLLVGLGYLASAAALVELLRRRGGMTERERPALVAIAGLTAYGTALLSYYVDRSLPHILIHIALPELLVATVWLGLALRAGGATARGGAAAAAVLGILVLAVAWSSVSERFPRTPLASAAPGGNGLVDGLQRLWHPPPLAPSAPAGVAALERSMPGTDPALVMTAADLGLEVLMRSGRADRLHLGDPWEASFAPEEELPGLARQVASLRPGERMLLDGPGRDVLAAVRAEPRRDPLTRPFPGLAPLQAWALRRIERRFALREVAPPRGGFSVVELTAR